MLWYGFSLGKELGQGTYTAFNAANGCSDITVVVIVFFSCRFESMTMITLRLSLRVVFGQEVFVRWFFCIEGSEASVPPLARIIEQMMLLSGTENDDVDCGGVAGSGYCVQIAYQSI